ncbi:MAG: hypothetical protein KBD78_02695 [Oligoflexales bacterium]|nr:hypothetical protein [Oligoflexales bacterium]
MAFWWILLLGDFGTKGIFAAENTPPSLKDCSLFATADDEIILFGGRAIVDNSPYEYVYYDAGWSFKSGEWACVSGYGGPQADMTLDFFCTANVWVHRPSWHKLISHDETKPARLHTI